MHYKKILALSILSALMIGQQVTQAGPAEDKKAAETADKKGDKPKAVGNPILAEIDNKKKVIRLSDVMEAIKKLPPELQEQVPQEHLKWLALQQLVRMHLVTSEAQKAGLEKDPEVQKRLEKLKQAQLMQEYMKRIMMGITPAMIKQEYDQLAKAYEQQKETEYHLFHILVKEEADAKKICEELGKGTEFGKLAQQHSIIPSKEKNGDEGYVMGGILPAELRKAVEGLKKGEYSKEPVKTDLGYHIVQKQDERPAQPPAFQDVQQELANIVMQKKLAEELKRLETGRVKWFNDDGSAAKNPEEMLGQLANQLAAKAADAEKPADKPAGQDAPAEQK